MRLAVINGDNNQQLRGVARHEGELPTDGKLQSLIGNGHLVITITPDQGERYQGIIALEADTLAACLEHYFAQSEQLATRLWIRTGHHEGEPVRRASCCRSCRPRARITAKISTTWSSSPPPSGRGAVRSGRGRDPLPPLPPGQGTGVRSPGHRVPLHLLPRPLRRALLQIDKEEAVSMVQELGKIDMHCDYCGAHYEFDGIDIETLFSRAPGNDANQLH